MQTRTYTIDPKSHRRLEFYWENQWKELTLYVDGVEVGTVPDRDALIAGQEFTFTLPDGALVKVKLSQEPPTPRLQVTYNDKLLHPDSSFNLSLITLLLGAATFIGRPHSLLPDAFLQEADLGMRSIIVGGVWVVLAMLMKQRARLAATLTFVLWLLDCLVSYIMLIATQGWGAALDGIPSGILVRAALLFVIAFGTRALTPSQPPHKPDMPNS
jgi:hypothetical protein